MNSRSLLVTGLVATLFILTAGSAFAQTFGEITGHITDASGAPVPATAVTATNTSTNAVRQTISSGTGDYAFPSLAPGVYSIKVEKKGFKATTSQVEVEVQQVVRLDLSLQVGAIERVH